MRSRKVALLISLALLLVTVLAAQLPSAGAAPADRTNVILIEVDGLEPKDVTEETTPFMWRLAHPEALGGDNSRAGWIWQAGRSVMTAGTAANAEALLTGGYPEQVGVPADEFFDPDSGETQRLEYQGNAQTLSDGAFQIDNTNQESATLLQSVGAEDTNGERETAAFVGNPGLSGIANDVPSPALKWWPKSDGSGGQSQPNPAYCDPPRRAPDSDPETLQPEQDPDHPYSPSCSATDLATLDHAASALGSNGQKVAFTYIHLAELGVIKRRDGDFSRQTIEANSPEAAQTVPQQLAQTDAAIEQFIRRYKDPRLSSTTADKWDDTFVFVVGSHGYETSSPDKRLPAPGGNVGTTDLKTWVERNGIFEYSAYGSMATISFKKIDDLAARRQAVAGIVDDLKPGGSVDAACKTPTPAGEIGESCIQELLYVRDDVAPATLPAQTGLLSEEHPNWRLDHLILNDDGTRTQPSRRSGDLVIVTKPGWGAGPVVSLDGDPFEDDAGIAPTGGEATDPYIGLPGGPRNRAVAAIVNGPGGTLGVRQVSPKRYPVTTAAVNCDDPPANPTAKYSLAQANANPEDDTYDISGGGPVGNACQPENVDFAPTIAALLQVGIDSDQLGGRFLQEAFLRKLEFPDIERLVDPPPPKQEPPKVVVLPPPPPPLAPKPPATWRYSGLMRRMRATVGDRRGHLYPEVREGKKLDYLILRADFGKPLAAVKLTFYQRVEDSAQARDAREQRRTVVKTLATFKPFSVRRARRAKLTLKVPEIFEPTHVGVVVRRARRLTRREIRAARARHEGEDVPNFKAYGPRAGGIFRVRYARQLHSRR